MLKPACTGQSCSRASPRNRGAAADRIPNQAEMHEQNLERGHALLRLLKHKARARHKGTGTFLQDFLHPTCLRGVGQIVVGTRVLPQLSATQVEYSRTHGILQSPLQTAGRVVLLLLVLADARAPVGSAGEVIVL